MFLFYFIFFILIVILLYIILVIFLIIFSAIFNYDNQILTEQEKNDINVKIVLFSLSSTIIVGFIASIYLFRDLEKFIYSK